MNKKTYITPALVCVEIVEEGLIASSPGTVNIDANESINDADNIGVRGEREWATPSSVMDNQW